MRPFLCCEQGCETSPLPRVATGGLLLKIAPSGSSSDLPHSSSISEQTSPRIKNLSPPSPSDRTSASQPLLQLPTPITEMQATLKACLTPDRKGTSLSHLLAVELVQELSERCHRHDSSGKNLWQSACDVVHNSNRGRSPTPVPHLSIAHQAPGSTSLAQFVKFAIAAGSSDLQASQA